MSLESIQEDTVVSDVDIVDASGFTGVTSVQQGQAVHEEQDRKTALEDEAKAHAAQIEEKKQRDMNRAREMINPDKNRTLTIHRLNRFGGKSGRCRFDVTPMIGNFPPAVIKHVSRACNMSYFPHRPSYGFAKTKHIKHPKANHYVVFQSFIRKYADDDDDGNWHSDNNAFFFFKDELDSNNPDFEPQTVTTFDYLVFLLFC